MIAFDDALATAYYIKQLCCIVVDDDHDGLGGHEWYWSCPCCYYINIIALFIHIYIYCIHTLSIVLLLRANPAAIALRSTVLPRLNEQGRCRKILTHPSLLSIHLQGKTCLKALMNRVLVLVLGRYKRRLGQGQTLPFLFSLTQAVETLKAYRSVRDTAYNHEPLGRFCRRPRLDTL